MGQKKDMIIYRGKKRNYLYFSYPVGGHVPVRKTNVFSKHNYYNCKENDIFKDYLKKLLYIHKPRLEKNFVLIL